GVPATVRMRAPGRIPAARAGPARTRLTLYPPPGTARPSTPRPAADTRSGRRCFGGAAFFRSRRGTLTTPTAGGSSPGPTAASSAPGGGEKLAAHGTGFKQADGVL